MCLCYRGTKISIKKLIKNEKGMLEIHYVLRDVVLHYTYLPIFLLYIATTELADNYLIQS
ncbi:hypothetical protein GCM10007096_22530 [Pullulanibacillus pueri]|uniref:Uncharacterized protein n=1 Tax=Pullulanibacillus pueri TaxID=1437324 RepID=A0A8J3EMC8_9BACL|nr:hypothetical protein GCM10007096_22530 [Pullulanibacillus pueri]